MTGSYEDIIHLPHHRSKHRPHMSLHDRAAQFSPFAALTGFDAAIEETGRLIDRRVEQEEYGFSILDRKLALLLEQLEDQPEVTLTVFVSDSKKSGGSYHEISGRLRKIDIHRRIVTMADGKELPMDDIIDICSGKE